MTDFPTAEEVADDTSFTEASLGDDMVRQPSLVAHYGRLVADTQFEMDTAKQKLEVTESKEAKALRDEAAESGTKISEAHINSSLPTNPKVMKARIAYNKAKQNHEAMKIALEALRHKRDMMIQIGVNARTEMENKIRLRELKMEIQDRDLVDSEVKNSAANYRENLKKAS